jgi:protein-L-isoaspartate(D-aspartate) O-methyltransferase
LSVRFTSAELAIVRRAFAAQVLAAAGVEGNAALFEAFASVPREDFVGPAPWQAVRQRAYGVVASDDPVVLYQDVNFALSPGRGVNNGSPTLHARWLDALGLLTGARVVHVGAGTGYYTALLSRLVGMDGQVLAIEYDPELADRARRNLAGFANVSLLTGDGTAIALEPSDAIYVNFAAGRPADRWIEALAPGGRLIFPLGVPGRKRGTTGGQHAGGAGFRIERTADGFAATCLGPAFFVYAEGALAPSVEDGEALREAFKAGGAECVRSLRWKEAAVPGQSWFSGAGWSLCYDAPVASDQ